ncbi:hypothetical protein D3C81_1868120 [compost metagenome]
MVNVPQGWWHYEVATTDNTHILAIFNASTPEVILGSDILTFTPAHIMAHTYCMDENKWKEVTAPVRPTTYIGPYSDCCYQNANYTQPQLNQPYPNAPQYNQYGGYR